MTTDRHKKNPVKALGLMSGGLDSILACLVLRRAGVDVEALTLATPFFGAEKAKAASKAYDIPLTVLDVGAEHLEKVVKNPRYGYGSNMNPCIDCHAYMLGLAGNIMKERGFDFIFTGEVLGQRPMSQNKQSLNTVAKASGFRDFILRPLSAKALAITPMEQNGLVDREKLMGITGRGRKEQMALAKELGVKDYPAPAGGCLLTEPGFSKRLKDLFEHEPGAGVDEVDLLKYGRHLRISENSRLIVGRKQAENEILERLAPKSAKKLITKGRPGPLGLFFGPDEGDDLALAAALVAGYGKAPLPGEAMVAVDGGRLIKVKPLHRRHAQKMML